MLAMVGELYDVERQAKDLSEDARLELRQRQSVPVLDRIKAWLDDESRVVLPRSPMAGAIGYVLNQWDALCVYATQGFLAIDNNAAERALKRVAIGRKNWLFAGNDRAGQTAATLYSLIAIRRAARRRPAAVSHQRAGEDRDHAGRRTGPVPAGRVEAGGGDGTDNFGVKFNVRGA